MQRAGVVVRSDAASALTRVLPISPLRASASPVRVLFFENPPQREPSSSLEITLHHERPPRVSPASATTADAAREPNPSKTPRRILLLGGISFCLGVIAVTCLAAKILPLLAVAATGSACVGLAVLANPQWATQLVVFALYSNLAVVAVRFHGVPKIAAAAYPLLLAIPLIDKVLVRREKLKVDAVFVWLLLFGAVQWVGAAFSRDPAFALAEVQKYSLEGLLLYFLLFNTLRDEASLRAATWALVIAGAVVGFFPLLQQLTGTFHNNYGGFGQTVAEDSFRIGGRSQLRLCGSIGEKNRFSQNMLMVAPVAWWVSQGGADRRVRWFGAGCALICLLGFALAFSRGSAIAAVMTVAILTCLRVVSPGQLLKIGLAGLLVLAIFPQYGARLTSILDLSSLVGQGPKSAAEAPDGSFRRRAEVMVAAGLVYLDHPVIGVGPGMSRFYSQEYGNQLGLRRVKTDRQSHNMILALAAETGTLGLVFFGGMMATLLVGLQRVRRRWLRIRPALAYLATGYLAALVLYLTTGLFLHMSYIRFIFLLVALAGATLAVGVLAKEEEERAEPEAIA